MASQNNDETEKLVKELMKALTKQGSRATPYDLRQQKILKSTDNILKEVGRISKKSTISIREAEAVSRYSSDLIEEAVNSMDTLKQVDKIFEKLPLKVQDAIKPYSLALSNSIKNVEDVFNVQKLTPILTQLHEEVITAGADIDKLNNVLVKIKTIEESTKIKLSDMGLNIEKYMQLKVLETASISSGVKVNNELQSEINETKMGMVNFSKALIKSNEAVVKFSDNILKSGDSNTSMVSKGINNIKNSVIGVVMAAGAKEIYEAIKSAAKFGVALDPVTAAMTGMSLKELPELQAKFKQTAMSIGGMNEFNDVMKSVREETRSSFIMMSGGLEEAARGMAQMTQNVRSFGDSSINTKMAVDDEIKMLGRFHNEMGMTTEQFTDLNSELINDQDIRNQLMRLDEKQRKGYMDNIRIRMLDSHQLGMSTEQAKAATKALAGIAGMDPKERLKMAARVQAMAGAMGMSEQGQILGKAIVQGSRASAQLQKEAGLAMGDIQEKTMQTMGEGFPQEVVASSMLNMDSMITNAFGPNSVFSRQLEVGRGFTTGVASQEAKQPVFGNNSALGDMFRKAFGDQGVVDLMKTVETVGSASEQGAILMTYTLAKIGEKIVEENYGAEITNIMKNWDQHGLKVSMWTSGTEDRAKAESQMLRQKSEDEQKKYKETLSTLDRLVVKYEEASSMGQEGVEQQKQILAAIKMGYGYDQQIVDTMAKNNEFAEKQVALEKRSQNAKGQKRD